MVIASGLVPSRRWPSEVPVRCWSPRLWVLPSLLGLLGGIVGLSGAHDCSEALAFIGVLSFVGTIVVLFYGQWLSPGDSMVAGVRTLGSSVPIIGGWYGLGYGLIALLGPTASVLAGVLWGLATWSAMAWVRSWNWAHSLGDRNLMLQSRLAIEAIGGLPNVVIMSPVLGCVDRVLHSDVVAMQTPGGPRYMGVLHVAEDRLVFQCPLPPDPALLNVLKGANYGTNTGYVAGLAPGYLHFTKDVMCFTIPYVDIVGLGVAYGLMSHNLEFQTKDDRRFRLRFGVFPKTRLIHSLGGAMAATDRGNAPSDSAATNSTKQA